MENSIHSIEIRTVISRMGKSGKKILIPFSMQATINFNTDDLAKFVSAYKEKVDELSNSINMNLLDLDAIKQMPDD